MSLKSFHIIFICISSLFSIFFGYWSYNEWSQIGGTQYIVYSLISVVFTIGLLIYGKWFLKEISGLNANLTNTHYFKFYSGSTFPLCRLLRESGGSHEPWHEYGCIDVIGFHYFHTDHCSFFYFYNFNENKKIK